MRPPRPVAVGLSLLLVSFGCAGNRSSLPQGARVVGGGLLISWSPPTAGTAILVETTTGKTVSTKSVGKDVEFSFGASSGPDPEILKAVLGEMPTNARFVLYFVPVPRK